MMKKAQSGFTLIELMIVVAIIAILAAIAIPAYNQYIKEANITRVSNAYSEGINAAKSEMARRQAVMARGQVYTELTQAEWVALFNPDGKMSPGDSTKDIFGAAADATLGIIGVVAPAATPPTVTFSLPAYPLDDDDALPATSVVVDQNSKAS